VPAPFWKAIEGGALGDGSLARFLVFLTDEHYPARQDAPEPADPPAELLAALTAIAAGAGGHDHGGNLAEAMQAGAAITPYTVPLTPGAETAMATARQHAIERLRAHQGTYATALFGRHAENTAKLAMLAAISRNPTRPVTEEHDVTWAHRLVDHCIGTLLREADRHVAETPAHARLKKVLDVIRSAGRIRRTEFTRRTQSLSKHERDDAIATLLDSKQIAIETAPNASGPDTTWIIAIEPEEGLKSHVA
jgi:hypothetical protein